LYSRWLTSERKMPNVICSTPTMIEIFILYELKKEMLLVAWCHAGSMPKMTGPFSHSITSFSQLNFEPQMPIGHAKISL